MSIHQPKNEPTEDEEHPATAGKEVLREVEEAETRVADDGRGAKDGEGSDALSPNEDAQEDVHHRGA
ncbi:hypothetical protein ACIQOF_27590 [Streptomyces sp. NPDC091265]|uniref:hypothetical protein n=1 Tax=unclassified Streptomyces TaxID=2593676 RepID=UPI00344D5ECF